MAMGAIAIERLCEPVQLLVSVAFTVKPKVPVFVAVPLMPPPFVMERPVGRAPEVTEKR